MNDNISPSLIFSKSPPLQKLKRLRRGATFKKSPNSLSSPLIFSRSPPLQKLKRLKRPHQVIFAGQKQSLSRMLSSQPTPTPMEVIALVKPNTYFLHQNHPVMSH